MAIKIQAVVDTAEQMLRTDVFSTAAKNGRAKTQGDRGILSKAEQEKFARYSLTYASADSIREERGEGGRKTAPASLVYQTALKSMNDGLEGVDRDVDVTSEWLDTLVYDNPGVGGVLHLAIAGREGDPITFSDRLESLRTFFGDNDIDMGGGVWVRTGDIPQDIGAKDQVLQLLRDFIAEREASAEETFDKSRLRTTRIGGTATGIRAAGESVAGDGFGETSTESTLLHATQIASLVKRMGDGVRHTSASARLVGESLQGETPVFAQVHMFFRPDGSYLTLSAIGGQASRSWEPAR